MAIPDRALGKIPGRAQYEQAQHGALVRLGGEDARFRPEVRAEKWGGTAWLRCRHADANRVRAQDRATERQRDGKPEVSLSIPGTGRTHRFREGSTKWEVVYSTEADLPVDGIERFTLELSPGAVAHYQPPLTPEEVAEGHIRPAEVVGSYAIYAPLEGRFLNADGTERVNYETGKIAHLYRPEMVAADGARAWLDQLLDGTELRVQLPPAEWFSAHPGPWVLDPTFGYSTAGASNFGTDNTGGTAYASPKAAPASGGTVTQFSIYCSVTNVDCDVKTALYNDAGANTPTSLVGDSPAASVDVGSSAAGWRNFSGAGTVAGSSNYWLAYKILSSQSFAIYYDVVAGTNRYWHTGTTWATWADPFVASVSSGAKYSVYATYTASGGAYTLTAAAGSLSLTGAAAGLLQGRAVSAAAGAFALTGAAANLRRGYPLSAASGSIALSGAAAGLLSSRALSAGGGSLAFTGAAGALLRGRMLPAAAGGHALTGAAADLLLGRVASAAGGSFALAAADADLRLERDLAAAGAAFVLAGAGATLVYTPVGGYVLAAEGAPYALAGAPADLLRSGLLAPGAGAFALEGGAAGLLFGRTLPGQGGELLLAGDDAGLRVQAVLLTGAGPFGLAGAAVLLVWSGEHLPRGRVIAVFRAHAPGAVFAARTPRASARGRSPGVGFTPH